MAGTAVKISGLLVFLTILTLVTGTIMACIPSDVPTRSYAGHYQEVIRVYQMPDGVTCYTFSLGISCIR